MKYYQVSRSAEPKIIGIKDGTSQVELIVKDIQHNQNYIDFANQFSGYNKEFFQNQEKIKSLNPPIFKGVLRKKAKVTDIMRYGQVFFYLYYIYSEKYIEILKTHNIEDYSLFDFDIEDLKEKYYLMFIKTIPTSEVKFDKSIIYTGHKVLNNVKYFSINAYEEFLDLLKSAPLATYEKIAISKEYLGRDIIAVQSVGNYFYSEKLIDFLLDCGITGLSIYYDNSIQLEFV